jgi:hypothetical protein
MLSDANQAILRELNASLSALEDDESVMVLCNGKMPDGTEFYAFVNIRANQLAHFYDSVRNGKEIRLGEFGEVIRSGEGLEPPVEIRKEMEAEYNLDYGLGEKLRLLFQA